MSITDGNGGITPRVKSVAIALSLIASLAGWSFSLGITYAQVHANSAEIETLRTDSRTDRGEVAALAERTAGLEATMRSIDSTLRDIRDEMRAGRTGR